MTETREFPTEVIASISTGIMLCDSFSAIHEAAEFLMGHPIFTHHFADKVLQSEMQKTVATQCPGMPMRGDITSKNWLEKRDQLIAELGPTQTISKGSGLTALLPTDGIPDHLKDKTIMVRADTSKD